MWSLEASWGGEHLSQGCLRQRSPTGWKLMGFRLRSTILSGEGKTLRKRWPALNRAGCSLWRSTCRSWRTLARQGVTPTHPEVTDRSGLPSTSQKWPLGRTCAKDKPWFSLSERHRYPMLWRHTHPMLHRPLYPMFLEASAPDASQASVPDAYSCIETIVCL